MNIFKKAVLKLRTAAAFTAAALLVCSVVVFALPAKTVSADVGQPDIPVPALSDVHCASYCVYDKTTGYIVISMNPEDRIYPASMTKIMTCMLSLEYLDTSAKITVSASALADLDYDSSLMGVLEGEKVKVSELLYGLMLPSGNDAANALGEGCVDAFFAKYPAGGTTYNLDGVNAQYLLDKMNDTQEHILSSRKLEAFALLMNLR
jgi:D-alanyl-D-alanine carboxypeptidase